MTTANTAAQEEYEDVVDLFAPRRHLSDFDASVTAASARRWIPEADRYAEQLKHWGDELSTIDFGFLDIVDPAESKKRKDREVFLQLVEQWHAEMVGVASSSMAEIIACPSYLRIIGMGWRALPLIIEQLEHEGDEPNHWCAALEAISGEDPVPENAHGDTVSIAQAWISWNKARVGWSFQTSTTRTIESLARRPIATTV